ncbi:TPA: NAD-dependent epimerase/dehydratase family protein [Staphylococcus pseudintermedius]
MKDDINIIKIFVTGATGSIGTRLTERLLKEGHDVAGFTTSEKRHNGLHAY